MPFSVEWQISVGGIDCTSRMNPYMEAIECSGHAGGKSDSARLTFNDNGGQLILPQKNSPVTIVIEGRTRFKGYTDAPEHVTSRGGGRTLEISCSAIDKTGKTKQKVHLHKDDATLEDFLKEWAQKSGLSGIKVDPQFANIKRPYWSTRGRHFQRGAQMLADELGATFKIRGDQAVFAARGSGAAPGGGSTPTIQAIYGVNLIESRMRPYEGRQRYAKARTRYYDRAQSKWLYKDVEIGDAPGSSQTLDLTGEDRPDADSSERSAKGRKTNSEREGGSGSLTISYNPDVEVEGTCLLIGVRPGVDGPYRIESWTDKINRDGGAETSLEVKQPQGDTGSDTRSAGS
ncbi:phage late control D family protein [Methylobacterium gnaphalii]|uniref:Late control protein D n=1 Tax=Methylobacterium gnaphalii TaxID=1010610 RepID=A0A512JPF3_9HYPH|nr:late control D family protein [Methylobacterium gnaphalii]GEP11835.1 hypothetical protein MGN01_36800 [Methylobacterium gnaphalii]GJD69419.1 hypothetical protein MMMDOFMJ_2350 [Methylobacterium gnaphalii]GLS49625.1 hypothetical protein GCM10007885_24740 [Methylobacterium gnaphalii]